MTEELKPVIINPTVDKITKGAIIVGGSAAMFLVGTSVIAGLTVGAVATALWFAKDPFLALCKAYNRKSLEKVYETFSVEMIKNDEVVKRGALQQAKQALASAQSAAQMSIEELTPMAQEGDENAKSTIETLKEAMETAEKAYDDSCAQFEALVKENKKLIALDKASKAFGLLGGASKSGEEIQAVMSARLAISDRFHTSINAMKLKNAGGDNS